jgi:hypothetical protein
MAENRQLYRVQIRRVGTLRQDSDVALCDLLELTEKGVLLHSDLPVAVGQTVELDFQLTPACPIHCTILVTHAAPPHVGGLIAAISPEHQRHISQFIEQLIEINLTGF